LAAHPGVRLAAVAAVGERQGRRLVAYAVPEAGSALDSEGLRGDLRAWLAGRLPSYMVPAVFVTLDSLPLTANGKVDRRALPAPGTAERAADGGERAPRTPIEELLAGIWEEVLGVGRVGA